MTPRLELRRDVLHLLCTEPLPHSAIGKKLPNMNGKIFKISVEAIDLFQNELPTKKTVNPNN